MKVCDYCEKREDKDAPMGSLLLEAVDNSMTGSTTTIRAGLGDICGDCIAAFRGHGRGIIKQSIQAAVRERVAMMDTEKGGVSNG